MLMPDNKKTEFSDSLTQKQTDKDKDTLKDTLIIMKLIIDCLGGDNSPNANIDGAIEALKTNPDLCLVLAGDENYIKPYISEKLAGSADLAGRLEILHAPDIITGEDKPTDAIRLKKESSMIKSIKLLREDRSVGGIISTGATGSLVAAATLRIGRLENVIRPCFCPVLPTMNGGLVGICDSGANIDCSADMLVQFAVMGSLYMSKVFNVESPRVALLNVGTESEKGDDLRRETYERLSRLPFINFVGNMESRDLLSGKYDLVVCDGFSGNVLIKSTEGTALQLLKKIKKDISSKFIYRLGALFMYKMFMEEKEFMNYQNYGGSVLLGTSRTIVKGHGSGDAKAVSVCINQACRMESTGLSAAIEETLEKLNAVT